VDSARIRCDDFFAEVSGGGVLKAAAGEEGEEKDEAERKAGEGPRVMDEVG